MWPKHRFSIAQSVIATPALVAYLGEGTTVRVGDLYEVVACGWTHADFPFRLIDTICVVNAIDCYPNWAWYPAKFLVPTPPEFAWYHFPPGSPRIQNIDELRY